MKYEDVKMVFTSIGFHSMTIKLKQNTQKRLIRKCRWVKITKMVFN